MNQYPDAIKKLIDQLAALPGLGPKTAERLVFYWLKQNDSALDQLVQTISRLKKEVTLCQRCYNIATTNPCPICADSQRDQQTICVVAEPPDVLVIEKTGDYHGIYHVLGGVLNPVEGITPDHLKIKELLTRVQNKKLPIKEIIIATNPDLEGESTAMYLARQLKPMNIKITRLAKGLPMGADLEYADEITVSSAIKGRQVM
jgi:recombination protein RecR